MKVAFYLNNEDFSYNRDFTNLLKGNPGIGGSEYMILLMSYLLSVRNNGIQVRLYAAKQGRFNQSVDVIVIDDIESAARHASENGFERFVFDHKRISWYKHPFDGLSPNIRLIPWCHCFAFTRELRIMCEHPNIGRIVNVGREQMDLMRDDKSFLISDYIYNCIPIDPKWIKKACSNPNKYRNHSVVYMGSLVHLKSFHVLAEIWPNICRRVPDAVLYVIGSGKVYGDNVELGDYGLADKDYEDLFMSYLTENGRLLDSVHFLGSLGEEKYEALIQAKVGVPNPTGKSETFCICAVEMQAMGCSVAAMEAPGYYDTFSNGYLADSKKKLEDNIVKLLLDGEPCNHNVSLNHIQHNFSKEVIVEEWETLLKSDLRTYLHPINPMLNKKYRYKWLKEILHIVKTMFPKLYNVHITVESILNKVTRNPYHKIAYHP